MSDEFDDAINAALTAEGADKKTPKPTGDAPADEFDEFDAAFEEELASELLLDDDVLADGGAPDDASALGEDPDVKPDPEAEDAAQAVADGQADAGDLRPDPAADLAPDPALDAAPDPAPDPPAAAPLPQAASATVAGPARAPVPRSDMPAEPDGDPAEFVGYERRGALGLISLTRPNALNALTLGMTRRISGLLDEAVADDAVKAVAIWSPQGRAFCAGGDIRKLWEWGRAGRRELFHFFREEYGLNHKLATLPKPLVSLMDGIVMGGGVGLALHAPHRVVSETVDCAMPEVGIGFVPDVGSTCLMARMPGLTGRFMALTGERIGSADMVWAGLADAVVPRINHDNLLDRLMEGEAPGEAIDAFATDPEPSVLQARQETLDELFAGEPGAVIQRLNGYDGPHAEWVGPLSLVLAGRCPFSVLAAHGLMERAQDADLAACLVNEFRAASRAIQRQDFYEGVRAAVVDKDRRPRWRPNSILSVDMAELAMLFEPSPMRDLSFPSPVSDQGVPSAMSDQGVPSAAADPGVPSAMPDPSVD